MSLIEENLKLFIHVCSIHDEVINKKIHIYNHENIIKTCALKNLHQHRVHSDQIVHKLQKNKNCTSRTFENCSLVLLKTVILKWFLLEKAKFCF